MDDSLGNGVDMGSSLIFLKTDSSLWTRKYLLRPGTAGAHLFFLCAKCQKGRLERNAKPLTHCIIPAAAAGWLGRLMILRLQLHLPERGPGTAESGPMRPRLGMQAARWVA